MKGIIFFITGLVLLAVAGYVYTNVNQVATGSFGSLVGGTTLWIPVIIPAVIGVIFVLMGILSFIRGAARSQELSQIATNGVETGGVITFVDRNYSLLVNNRPIYSIVEYRYRDIAGREFAKRVDNVKTEAVIRAGWQVGMPVRVRYLAADPTKSALADLELARA